MSSPHSYPSEKDSLIPHHHSLKSIAPSPRWKLFSFGKLFGLLALGVLTFMEMNYRAAYSSSSLHSLKPLPCASLPPLPPTTFLSRLSTLSSYLPPNTAYISEPSPNTLYFANYSSLNWGLSERVFLLSVHSNGDLTILTPYFEESRARKLPIPEEVKSKITFLTWKEAENPYSILLDELVSKSDNGKLGIQFEENVRMFVVDAFEKAGQAIGLKGEEAKFGLVEGKAGAIRQMKSEGEIARQRCAEMSTLTAVREVRKRIKVGMTELEVQQMIDTAQSAMGLSHLDHIVLFGANAALPHAGAGSKVLKEREFVLLDVGGYFQGYYSDLTRTVLPPPSSFKHSILSRLHHFNLVSSDTLSKHTEFWPSERAREIWTTVQDGQKAGFKSLWRVGGDGKGVMCADVDRAAREVIADKGYGEGFTHRVGHGIGLQVHEGPYLNSGNTEQELFTGATFSIEPGIYIEEDGTGRGIGVRLEDTFVKTKTGGEALSGRLALSPWDP